MSPPAPRPAVVVALFANRDTAERMVASLCRGFRKKAQKGGVAAAGSGSPSRALPG